MSLLELITSLELGLIFGIVTIGVYLSFRIINFSDLTCDGSFVLGAAAYTIAIKAGYHYSLALVIATIAGSMAGLTTGVLHKVFRISEILSGILVAFMLYSINLQIMKGVPNITLPLASSIATYKYYKLSLLDFKV